LIVPFISSQFQSILGETQHNYYERIIRIEDEFARILEILSDKNGYSVIWGTCSLSSRSGTARRIPKSASTA
jgi:hypothetical protein